MGDRSSIEWTDATWNPVRARNKETGRVGWHCTKPSRGCAHCYAEAMNTWRGTGLPFAPSSRQKIDLFLDRRTLEQPLRWKQPRMIFACDMSDLFHEDVPYSFIADVFLVMNHTPQHTYQILTKRPARMLDFSLECQRRQSVKGSWPMPNAWLGVSVEDQATADERIPLLLQTPAAVRFVSAEPLLGPVDLTPWLKGYSDEAACSSCWGKGCEECRSYEVKLDWVIPGGESGPKARPCDVAWIRAIIAQCKAAGVAPFVKQLGALPYYERAGKRWGMRPGAFRYERAGSGLFFESKGPLLRDRKGGDPSEWPEDLRVREFPQTVRP